MFDIGRKGGGRAGTAASAGTSSSSFVSTSFSPATHFLLFLVSLGFALATYNLVTTVVRYPTEIGHSSVVHSQPDLIVQMPEELKKSGLTGFPFHVALTAIDTPYSKRQCWIMYYWYKKVKEMPGSEMGGFTRILHSGSPDNLMDEILTFVVDPLPVGLDRGYIVLSRSWAFMQWLEKAKIEEEYILMAEPDHGFVNPLSNLACGDCPASFPFFYIKPKEHEKIVRKFYPKEKGPMTDIDPIGR